MKRKLHAPTIKAAPAGVVQRLRRRLPVLRRLWAQRSFRIGFAIAVVLALAAVFAPALALADPTQMHIRFRFRHPSAAFPLGTDAFGRDVYSRLLYGTRLSLWIGLSVTLISGVAGTAIGVVAGYFRALDQALMRTMDGLMAFPAILLAIGVSAALGPHLASVIIALAVAYVPRTARIVRASTLSIREMEFVQAAQVTGAGSTRIVLRHVLPNCMGPLLVQLTFTFAYAILAEATLSFLGVGGAAPTPSWATSSLKGVTSRWMPGGSCCFLGWSSASRRWR